MATDPPADLTLVPLRGKPRTIDQLLTTFQLVVVVLDPYTNESAWILDTAGRILNHFSGADCRVGFLVTAGAEDAEAFLGPWAERCLVFADPDRRFVKATSLNELPALVHIRQDRKLLGVAEGWDPLEWRAVAHGIAKATSWSAPVIPLAGDPSPYAGTAAVGA